MRLGAENAIDAIRALHGAACDRSWAAVAHCRSLGQVGTVPSFGPGPVNLRWILVHMIEETVRHAGCLDLVRDALAAG
jgi:hypothetical protein